MLTPLRRCGPLLIALAGQFLAGDTLGAQQRIAPEYQIKAAFLYNFAKFVEWPPSVMGDPDSPIAICVAGKNPFGSALADISRVETAQGRALVIHPSGKSDGFRDCHILFIGETGNGPARNLLDDLSQSAVLTVGDTERIGQLGTVINFTIDANMVRFEVDVDAAQRARIKISSHLLRVAKSVRSVPGGEDADFPRHPH